MSLAYVLRTLTMYLGTVIKAFISLLRTKYSYCTSFDLHISPLLTVLTTITSDVLLATVRCPQVCTYVLFHAFLYFGHELQILV